jgi:hypothetical protein
VTSTINGAALPAMAEQLHQRPAGDTAPAADAAPSRRPWYGPLLSGDVAALWPAAVVAFAFVLVIGFTMSYHGLFEFGAVIMHWSVVLCALAPIGVDLFSMVTLLATFLTHDARWRVRVYMWMALGCTVAVSVAGNALAELAVAHAAAAKAGHEFEWGYQQFSSVAGAAIWPFVYALALHVLIVVRRHLDHRGDKAKELSQQVADEAAAELLLRARAIELAAAGTTVTDILVALELEPAKRRTVERWTETVRTALAGPLAVKPATRRTTRGATS